MNVLRRNHGRVLVGVRDRVRVGDGDLEGVKERERVSVVDGVLEGVLVPDGLLDGV